MNIGRISNFNTPAFGARFRTKTKIALAKEVDSLKKQGKTKEADELQKTIKETRTRIREYGDAYSSLTLFKKDFGKKIGFKLTNQNFNHPFAKSKFITTDSGDLKTALENIKEEDIDRAELDILKKLVVYTRKNPIDKFGYDVPWHSANHWNQLADAHEKEIFKQ